MGQRGQCCEHAGDCASGICINGTCWSSSDLDQGNADDNLKIIVILIIVASAMIFTFLVIYCCIRNMKLSIYLQAQRSEERRQKKLE